MIGENLRLYGVMIVNELFEKIVGLVLHNTCRLVLSSEGSVAGVPAVCT
jgi:hypothetical protein